MPKYLSRQHVERYASDGCVFPIDVLSPLEAAEYRRRLEYMEARYGNLHYAPKPHLTLTFTDELIRHPKILDAVEDIIGPNILVWDATFIVKEAHDPRFVSWHQDLTYWSLEPPDVVSVWLALSPSTPESGCVRFVPGSHTRQLRHRDTFAEDNILSRGQEVAAQVDERTAIDIILAPGQMSLHHGRVVHGSAPNRSDERRIGFNIQYLPTHVKQVVGDRDSAMLVRGVDSFNHFEAEHRPSVDFTPESMAAFRMAIAERRSKYLYQGVDRTPA
ncbi:MAG: phytanoyl-CoA dioxygenase family protein [Candidatus Rokubacteria bacterium]|nr:phytanoyl-CoA dioxygenase family protein [Candidatus Rokubacteria bacterium]MBI3454675.1 phytanoyl-CoA dioxygenase family protein [Candidatus Rokubacteria bacterium]